MAIPEKLVRGPFGIKDHISDLQVALGRLWGRPQRGMRTEFRVSGAPVIFLHNPKTGGNSLRKVLGVSRISHTFASERLSEREWIRSYSIVVVRHPFERFLSGYYSHILRPDRNGLVKMYGWDIKKISPFEYLEVLDRNPKYGGRQTLWTDYPSHQKPRADLVLRLEDVSNWIQRLTDAGIRIQGREIEHLNKSDRENADHASRLNLDEAGYEHLRQVVRTYFAGDYDAFNYD